MHSRYPFFIHRYGPGPSLLVWACMCILDLLLDPLDLSLRLAFSLACSHPEDPMTDLACLARSHCSPWLHYCLRPQLLQLLATLSKGPAKTPSLTRPRGREVLPGGAHSKRMKSGCRGKMSLEAGKEVRKGASRISRGGPLEHAL